MHRAGATAARVAQDAAENRRPKLILPRAKTTAVVQDANVSLPAGWCARFARACLCAVLLYICLKSKLISIQSAHSPDVCIYATGRGN
ncbi:hypothetical protein T09_9893 [Trichinella sp. T9]|nr:hypothetical protein T09_9893 [Trichinella sp. T9]